jgi:hypothetical protein
MALRGGYLAPQQRVNMLKKFDEINLTVIQLMRRIATV